MKTRSIKLKVSASGLISIALEGRVRTTSHPPLVVCLIET